MSKSIRVLHSLTQNHIQQSPYKLIDECRHRLLNVLFLLIHTFTPMKAKNKLIRLSNLQISSQVNNMVTYDHMTKLSTMKIYY